MRSFLRHLMRCSSGAGRTDDRDASSARCRPFGTSSVVARLASAGCLIGLGYWLGVSGLLGPAATHAQPTTPADAASADDPSEAAMEKIKAAYPALNEAMVALSREGRYKAATEGLNCFAVLAGGVDALADLESGRGVDPITFAGLYAGQAIPEVADELDFDENQRLTYKGKLVRMYSIARLKKMFENQRRYTGQETEKQ